MPPGGAARRECRFDCARATAEPPREAAEQKADGAEERPAGDRLGCCVGCLRRLLLGLFDSLPVLLLVLLNLRSRLLDRNVLRPRDRLRCPLPRFLRLLLISGDGCPHGGNRGVP